MTGVPSQAKRQAILVAATEAFLRSGYAASVDEIAATAGVGKQTVYRHFGDKQSLFLAAVAAARTEGRTANPPDWSFRASPREPSEGTHAPASASGHAPETTAGQTTEAGDSGAAWARGGSSTRGGGGSSTRGGGGSSTRGGGGSTAGPVGGYTTRADAVRARIDGRAVEERPAGDGEAGDWAALPDIGDPVADLTVIGEQILVAALSPTVAALHRLTVAEIGNHPELSRHWGDGAAPFVDDGLAGYFRHCDEAGLLDVPDPGRAARQFAYLLVTEGRVASAYGTRPLTPEQSHRLAAETADLIVRAHRPR